MEKKCLVGIDGNEANVSERVGIGRYALELIRHLYALQNSQNGKHSLSFHIYLKNDPGKSLPVETSHWKYKMIGPPPFWTQLALPLSLYGSSEKPNIFFSPTHYAPRFSPVPTAISIMDLSFIHFPELFTEKDLHQLRHWTSYSVSNAKKIFTISKFTKEDVVKIYGIDPKKVEVTYPGYDKAKFKKINGKEKIEKIKKTYGISGDYMLFVGTLQPRKNILSLILAFDMLLKNHKLAKSLQLVIVGKKGWLYNDIFEEIDRRQLGKKIIFTDYAPEGDLPFLYAGATCFVLPSFYEGFGLTVVEAMACGVPVIVSGTSCLPEIVGDAGILVDPTSVDSIAKAIIQVVGWKSNQRKKSIGLGLAQVGKFDWDRSAKQTLTGLLETANKYV